MGIRLFVPGEPRDVACPASFLDPHGAHTMRTRGRTASLAFLGLFVLGCGGQNLGDVSGKVTLGGQPLAGATVIFQPEDGSRPSMGVTNEDGEYELQYDRKTTGAVIGKHRVSITTGQEGNDGDESTAVAEKVPAKYNVKSELVKEVESGSNEIDFALDAEGEIVQPGGDPEPDAPEICGGGWEEFDDLYDEDRSPNE